MANGNYTWDFRGFFNNNNKKTEVNTLTFLRCGYFKLWFITNWYCIDLVIFGCLWSLMSIYPWTQAKTLPVKWFLYHFEPNYSLIAISKCPPRIRFNQFINNCKFKFILKIYLLVIAFYIYICLIFTKNLQINGVCFIEPYFLDVKCQYLLSSLLFEPTNQWVSPKSGMITFGWFISWVLSSKFQRCR